MEEIPQPLIISGGSTSYPSKEALIGDIAIKLFVNTNLSMSKNVQQAAKEAFVNAEILVNTVANTDANKYIDALISGSK